METPIVRLLGVEHQLKTAEAIPLVTPLCMGFLHSCTLSNTSFAMTDSFFIFVPNIGQKQNDIYARKRVDRFIGGH